MESWKQNKLPSHLPDKHTVARTLRWSGRESGGAVVFSHLSSASGGVEILFWSLFLPISFEYEEVVKGWLLKVTAKYKKNMCFLIFTHQFCRGINVCSDLSSTLEGCHSTHFLKNRGWFQRFDFSDLDRKSRRILKRIIETYDLEDVWRRVFLVSSQRQLFIPSEAWQLLFLSHVLCHQ